jgi:hypothetical protein
VVKGIEAYLDQHPESWKLSGGKGSEKVKFTTEMVQSMARQVMRRYLFPKPKPDKQQKLDPGSGSTQKTSSNVQQGSVRTSAVLSASNKAVKPSTREIIESSNPWKVLDAYKAVLAEESIFVEKHVASTKKSRMASNLNVQKQEKEMIEAKELKEKRAHDAELQRKLDEWKQQTKEFERDEQKQTQQLREIRLAQIEESKKQKKVEKEALRIEGERIISKCRAELDHEDCNRRKKQHAEIQRHHRTKKENLKQENIREKMRAQEELEELKSQKEAKHRQEAEDQRRKKEFKDRFARYEEYGKRLEASKLVQEQREESLRLEKKILREAKEKEERDLMREKRDKMQLVERRRQTAETNLQMADEKQRQEKAQQLLDRDYSNNTRIEGEKHLVKEHQKKVAERNDRKKYFTLLQQQEKQSKIEKKAISLDSMTSVERSVNREALEKILGDETLQKRIVEKLMSP